MARQIDKNTLKTPKTGRFFQLGTVQNMTKSVWFCLHGYGQSAEYFAKHFADMGSKEHVVVVPEGLSRFYIDGISGRVGASWMTKIDREDEIEDQQNYLNLVAENVAVSLKDSAHKIVLLGFSQGTATTVRWMVNSGIKVHALVLWAGSFPHDVEIADAIPLIGEGGFHCVYGTEDEYLKNLDMTERLTPLAEAGLKPKIWTFDGTHTMHKPTLQKILDSTCQ